MTNRRVLALFGCFAAASVLVACDGEPAADAVTAAVVPATGPVAAEPQRAGDPAAGYQALVNNAYVTCGVPDEAYRQTAPPPDPKSLLRDRTGRNAELPYMLTAYTTADDVDLVANCLTCHASYLTVNWSSAWATNRGIGQPIR